MKPTGLCLNKALSILFPLFVLGFAWISRSLSQAEMIAVILPHLKVGQERSVWTSRCNQESKLRQSQFNISLPVSSKPKGLLQCLVLRCCWVWDWEWETVKESRLALFDLTSTHSKWWFITRNLPNAQNHLIPKPQTVTLHNSEQGTKGANKIQLHERYTEYNRDDYIPFWDSLFCNQYIQNGKLSCLDKWFSNLG